VGVELLEREVKSVRKVLFVVLVLGQDLDQLGVLLIDEAAQLMTVNSARHVSSSQRFGELVHGGGAADAGFAPVQPARQTGGFLRGGEGILPVDEDRR
jgi:hypothetical protein